MSKISVVIPHVPISKEFDEMLDECVQALKGDYDELVLVLNDGIGYGKAFNKCFRYATGDFLVAVSNDAILTKGSVRDLCDEKAVTYSGNSQWGCFFCLPRWVLETIGYFDERIGKAYHEDDNWLSRLKRADIPLKRVSTVAVDHLGGITVKAMGKEDQFMKTSRPIYQKIEQELDEGASLYVPPCGNSCKDKSNCQWNHL